uniref:Uncharacterized protein n=1 Tax=Alexandrium monilatum TaxID=311494 RepID=A0A7S4WCT8_9DINO
MAPAIQLPGSSPPWDPDSEAVWWTLEGGEAASAVIAGVAGSLPALFVLVLVCQSCRRREVSQGGLLQGRTLVNTAAAMMLVAIACLFPLTCAGAAARMSGGAADSEISNMAAGVLAGPAAQGVRSPGQRAALAASSQWFLLVQVHAGILVASLAWWGADGAGLPSRVLREAAQKLVVLPAELPTPSCLASVAGLDASLRPASPSAPAPPHDLAAARTEPLLGREGVPGA